MHHTVADFDFALPPALIAQHPTAERSVSRLLDGRGRAPADRIFRDLPALLDPGDLLVFNDTKVIKARLFGRKASGGVVEVLVERMLTGHEVLAHLRASKSPRPGTRLRLADAFDAEVLGRGGRDDSLFQLRFEGEPLALLEAHGHVPLPPYIAHADDADDERRYQTVFAARPGAVAAPTAALHFDAPLLEALRERGIATAYVTLHVGAGTFQPVRAERLQDHRMHSEWYEVGPATVAAVAAAHERGARVVAVGTTSVRALESAARASGSLAGRARRDRHLHHPGPRIPRRRCPADQLPPAAQHADDAGLGLCRPRPGDGAVSPRHRSRLPLLQLRRRHAAGPRGAGLSGAATMPPGCSNSNCWLPKAVPAAAA